MKILYIVTYSDGGGAQKYVLDMARHFDGEIAAGGDKTDLFDSAKNLNITAHHLKHLKRHVSPLHDILALFEIYRLIKKVNPDIVHLNSTKAGLLGSIAGKLSGKKVVFTAHGIFFFQNTSALVSKIYSWVEKFASIFRDKIIAVSNADLEQLLKHRIISPKKTTMISYGIKPVDFLSQEESRTKLKLSANTIIGCIAQYFPRKGLVDLINAYAELPSEDKTKTQMILIGDGPQKVELQNQINNLKLNQKITLTGYLKNAASYMKGFDIFVLPSYQEGFPYVLIEARQAKLPIIASDAGGNKEVIGDSGILFQPGDALNLTKAIHSLISNPELRTQSIKYTSHIPTEQEMFERTRQIYKELL